MRVLLALLMGWLLFRSETAMAAAADACRLFVQSVLPGLFPYMTLSLMLVSRMQGRMPPWLLVVLGWCGGSPAGARLLAMHPPEDGRACRRAAAACATMSPMFLVGTVGAWLGSGLAGVCVLMAVLGGGVVAAGAAGLRRHAPLPKTSGEPVAPLSLGAAVTSAAGTMLMVCGTMTLLRVFAALVTEATDGVLSWLTLPLTSVMEVTCGVLQLTRLPLPLPLRTALAAGATGMGGMAVLMQNRALYPRGLVSLGEQALWQVLHGAASFLLALGLMLLLMP